MHLDIGLGVGGDVAGAMVRHDPGFHRTIGELVNPFETDSLCDARHDFKARNLRKKSPRDGLARVPISRKPISNDQDTSESAADQEVGPVVPQSRFFHHGLCESVSMGPGTWRLAPRTNS